MKSKELKKGIYWVGAIDWNLRDFHGYKTEKGSSYNAYLIIDEKIALIDTVKAPLVDQLVKRVKDLIDPSKIDYIISNHVEMDHSGSLGVMQELCPKAEIVADARGIEGLKKHFRKDWPFRQVKTGETINLGKRSLTFLEMAMVHWPDSMATYCPEEKILFPNDAFGQHIASMERFADEFPLADVLYEAKKYYANIVMPFGGPVQKALEAVKKMPIEMIASSHGLIWRKNIEEIVKSYESWSKNETSKKVVIVYDTMWNSTEKMADSLCEGIATTGAIVRKFNLRFSESTEIMTELLDAKIIAVGSPTLNNGMLPTVGSFLTYMKGLKPKGRKGLVFGSYGWAGGAAKAISAELAATGIEEISEHLTTCYIPTEEDLKKCFNKGIEIGNLAISN